MENIDEVLSTTFQGLDWIEKHTTASIGTTEECALNAIPMLKNMILKYFNKK